MTRRVCMVVGWGRSGSTLLDRLLGQLPGWLSAGELREFWLRGPVEDRRCGCGRPFHACPHWQRVVAELAARGVTDPAGVRALQRRIDRGYTVPLLRRSPPLLLARDATDYRVVLDHLYDALVAASGAAVVIDSSKLASHALLVDGLPNLDLRFVHLVRDPRGVATSWAQVTRRADGDDGDEEMLRYGPMAAALRWDYYNAAAERLARTGRPYLRLRHEDLVADPAGTIQRLAEHLDVDLPAGALDFLDGHTAELAATHLVDGNPMRFRVGQLEVRRDEGWRDRMAARDRRTVTALTAPWRRRYGYGD